MVDYTKVRSKLKNFSPVSLNDDGCWSEINELIAQVFVPKNAIIKSRPFEREDFSSIPDVAKQTFQTLQAILSSLSDNSIKEQNDFLKLIYSSIILCGEHSGSSLWTDNECFDLSRILLNTILRVFQCENVDSFLVQMDHEQKLHGNNILCEILPKLSKDSWKCCPATVQCYSWLVHQIKLPNMKYFVHISLPVSLVILSDHQTDNKIVGLNCLHRIISNVSKAELNWNIQIEVLQNILKPLFYYRESELILPLIKCAIEVSNKTNLRFKDAGVDLKWSFFDEVLSVILPMMEYEQDLQRRLSYIQSLCIILEHSNLAVGRWSQRILRIVDDYAKIPMTELDAIITLNLFIKTCWPLIIHHWRHLNLISGRVLYQSNNERAISESKFSLKMLKELLPNEKNLRDAECIETKRRMK